MDVYVGLIFEQKIQYVRHTIFSLFRNYHDKKRQQNLTEDEHRIRERWEKAWFLLCSHNTQKDAAAKIEKLFSIGRSVAYDDMRNAMLLFGDPRNDLKDAKRAIAETMVLKGAKKAWKEGDLEAHQKYMKQYIELNRLDSDDDTRLADLLKKMRPVQVVFVSERAQLEKQASDLMKDVPTVDVDYEEAGDEKEN